MHTIYYCKQFIFAIHNFYTVVHGNTVIKTLITVYFTISSRYLVHIISIKVFLTIKQVPTYRSSILVGSIFRKCILFYM